VYKFSAGGNSALPLDAAYCVAHDIMNAREAEDDGRSGAVPGPWVRHPRQRLRRRRGWTCSPL